MTRSAAAWQLDRLSAGAREAAEIASLAAGLSLSAWLTRVIADTSAAEGLPPLTEMATDDLASDDVATADNAARDDAHGQQPPRTDRAGEPANVVEFPVARERVLSLVPRAPLAVPEPANETSDTILAPAPAAVGVTLPPAPVPALAPPSVARPAMANATAEPPSRPKMLPIAAIVAGNLGTRRGESVPDALLSDIATRGVRQPLLLRPAAEQPERYEIVCGHRRWRAAQRVGLTLVPGIVASYNDETALLASLKENLDLGTLSAIEEASAYLRLLTECAMDASVLTATLGRERRDIVRSIRLLGLPPLVRHLIASGMLSRDHADVLLDAAQPEMLADAILAEGLSVEAARERLAGASEARP